MFVKIAFLLFAAALCKETESACCFAPTSPLVLVPPSGSAAPAPGPCSCACFKDVSSPCASCPAKPKPACACLEAAGSSCSYSEQSKAFLYFPEVTYPVTCQYQCQSVEGLEPFYFNTCFSY